MEGIERVLETGLGNASYLLELGDGGALVVDPGRDPRLYLRAAAARRLRVRFVADTHLHNDFVSGNLELAREGAAVLVPAGAEVDFASRPLEHGDEVDLGGFALRALSTSGHTPEHISYLLLDQGRPVAVFTGGSLLDRSVGRTDLLGDERTIPLARELYHSVHRHLLTLPDDVVVFPTHGVGASFCAAQAAAEPGEPGTIGDVRAADHPLLVSDEEAFVGSLVESYGSYPSYFGALREVNRRDRQVFGETLPTLPALPAAEVRRLKAEGAVLVDVRPVDTFAAEHASGALSIELRPAFSTWLGWLVPNDVPLVFVVNEDQDRRELVRQCLNIGYERLDGELAGGMLAWSAAGLPTGHVDWSEPNDATDHRFLDIRQASEYAAGHIPGAIGMELGSVSEDMTGLPRGPLTVHCGHGERAMTAASVLLSRGRRDISVLRGGPGDWSRAAGRRLEVGAMVDEA